jgi:dTDP-4-amino-4,6-dideoxygalactose transaminase
VQLPAVAPYSTHVYHQYTLRIEAGLRDGLKQKLAEAGVPSMIYYPSPLHTQPAYAYLGYRQGDFPIAEQLCTEVLSLPMHSELTETEVDYIAERVRKALA